YAGESLEIEGLEKGKTYYWRVVVKDGFAERESEIRMFEVKEENDEFEIGEVAAPTVILPFVTIVGVVGTAVLLKRRRKEEGVLLGECPRCGKDMVYVDESEDFYCWGCEEYLEYIDEE
ncbi:MAG: hypothetical protein KAU14_05185, partial [Thermoplasmata archaeon]|nr:hypothetical protein [Thermoplasmata archaeon]